MTHSVFFVIGFILYVVAMIFVAARITKGKTQGEDYLMAGRNLGIFVLLGTLAATAIGTGSSMGATANGFRSGYQGAAFGVANAIGFTVIGLIFVQVRKWKFRTICEELQFYYNGNTVIRRLAAFMVFIVTIVWVGVHMNGGSKYLSYITGLDPLPAKIITTLAFGVYVFIGGYLAVVWTDVIQAVLLLTGFIMIAALAIPIAGGWDTIQQAYISSDKAKALSFYGIAQTGVMGFLSLCLASFYGSMAGPTNHMRVLTAKDEKTAKKGMLINAVIVFLFSFLPTIIGMSAYAIALKTGNTSVIENPDYAFSFMATTVLGPILGLFFLIAGLSATMSSADSDSIAGVTVLITDVYSAVTKKKVEDADIPKVSKATLVALLSLAFLATLYAGDIMQYINEVYGSVAPGLGVALIMGRLWKRATWQGGVAAIMGGLLSGIMFLVVPALKAMVLAQFKGPAIPITLLSIFLCIIVSLMTPRSTLSDEEKVSLIMNDRDA